MKTVTWKQFERMTTAEKNAFANQFDRVIPASEYEKPTPDEKAKLRRAMQKLRRGRPKIGKGAKRVLVTIERGLLEETDSFAKRRGISRAALISKGLRCVLAAG
ncbi:MAG: hypothetical protein ACHRHE_14670 [Tepidisphaerales bacterium]